jgi:hypothetical protein
MTERGILFKGRLVRRILAGAKTQTRRIIKPSWSRCLDLDEDDDRERARIGCPYGAPGDRLWVKETWQTASSLDKFSPSKIAEHCKQAGYSNPWAPILYAADGHKINASVLPDFGGGWGKTRVSIHMPRWASRITLDVVRVRVERVQDISEADSIAEGVASALIPADEYGPVRVGYCAEDDGKCGLATTARKVFVDLWKSVHGPEGWDANPFVWVIEFGVAHVVAKPARAA